MPGRGGGGGRRSGGSGRLSSVDGVEETISFLSAYQREVPNFARGSLRKLAEEILRVSQDLVPVRREGDPPKDIPPGSLKASGRVVQGEGTGSQFSFSVTYGAPYGQGRIANYAVWVHEMPYNHTTGQWKYLTTAVDIVAPNAREIVRYNIAQMQTQFFGTRGGGGRGRMPLSNQGQ